MLLTLRAVMALSLVAVVAACNPPREEPVYVTDPVQPAPVFTGKYR